MNVFSLENDRWLRVIGVPLIGIAIPFITPLVTPCSSNIFFMERPYLYSIPTVLIIFEVNRSVILYFRKKYSSLGETSQRISRQIPIQLLLTIVLLSSLLYIWYKYLLNAIIFVPFLRNNMYVGVSLPVMISLLYEADFIIKKWKAEFIRNQSLTNENTKAQLHILKKQIDPHFLFNSLGTLSSLIESSPATAVEFVNEFSDIYRYIIVHRDTTLIELNKELSFANNYISLLEKRFAINGLKSEIDVPPAVLNKKVPTLTVQMLVENIIKHNSLSTEKPLNIEIYTEQNDTLVVKNNVQRKSIIGPTTQIGLSNIIQRYLLVGMNTVNIIEDDSHFMVKIPLLD